MKRILLLAFTLLTSYISIGQCNTIYVIPTPFSIPTANLGTKADPTDLLSALSVLAQPGDIIKMGEGTYTLSNPINAIPDFVTLEGGFDFLNNWEKSSQSGLTTIYRDSNNVKDPSLPTARIAAFEFTGARGFRFQDLTIQVQNAPQALNYGVSTYGLACNNCSEYNIIRCRIIAGDASKGIDGVDGAVGIDGDDGLVGLDGHPNTTSVIVTGGNGGKGGSVANIGGTGGISPSGFAIGGNGTGGTISGSFREGTGGAGGGSGGKGDFNGGLGRPSSIVNGDTANCSNLTKINIGPGSGTAGISSGCNSTSIGSCDLVLSGKDGDIGSDGNDGCDGTNGLAGSALVFWNAGAPGGDGTHGQGGAGGGGGGGGAGEDGTFCLLFPGAGAGGGGGGGGGQGGEKGTGAYGGGSSFAVYLHNNSTNGIIDDCFLLAGSLGTGGIGGNGGTGGTGGAGGAGGIGIESGVPNYEVGCGGKGGDGGDAGKGGDGGDGADGVSNPLFISGIGLIVQDIGFNLSGQPVITINEEFCAGDVMNFTGPVSANWSFGLNSTPLSATGASVQTSYTLAGRKDIQYGSDDYKGFANISTLSPTVANAGNDTVVCSNINLNGNTPATGTGTWTTITSGASASTPTNPNSPTTLAAGDNIFIWTISFGTCCPESVDTVVITYQAQPISATGVGFTNDSLCESESTQLFVQGGDLGFGGQWVWYANGCGNTPVAVGDTITVSPIATTTYYVRVESPCDTTACVSKTINFGTTSIPPSTISANTDTICRGDSITLTLVGGSLINGDQWQWYSTACGGAPLGSGTSITVGPEFNTTYFVRGEGGSCDPSECTSRVVYVKGIIVALLPFDTICGVLQPVELKNGIPAGGIYSGIGVVGNTFDPIISDYGNHIITYELFDRKTGCNVKTQAILTVSESCSSLEDLIKINTFSPNGDGVNDTWNLNLSEFEKGELVVYNKWGNLVYKSDQKIIQWDGTFKGKGLPSGSYFFLLTADGETYKGDITILR